MMARLSFCTALAAIATLAAAQTTPLTGRHTDLPRWCGKPYQPALPNYDPGGQVVPPAPLPSDALFIQVVPRHSIYVSSEEKGEFVIDAQISRYCGTPLTDGVSIGESLKFEIKEDASRTVLVKDEVAVNSTRNVYNFDLGLLQPRLDPYSITFTTEVDHGDQRLTATSQLYFLPAKTNGSMVKIDNLNGGMLMANEASDFHFQPILPFGFYTSCSGYLTSKTNVSLYKDMGFTAINPVCALPDEDVGSTLFDWLDELNMPYQYDMRNSFYNLTSVAAQVPLIKDRSSLLSWYTADEPDGWQYSFNSSTAVYEYLKRVDPYHPTGLVLNCANYYFDEYSVGTDYIMEDAYPIGINATFSKWGTACNATYGDCGCDNCVGALHDVSDRLDMLKRYQTWLGRPQKPLWTVAQAFSGEGYWSRDPTPNEAWAMNLLGFNHGAKAVMNWQFPASETLNEANSAMAKVFTAIPVSGFLLDGQPTPVQVVGHEMLDVAYWKCGGQVMVAMVNQDYNDSVAVVRLQLPWPVKRIVSQPWGKVSFQVHEGRLELEGITGVATSVVILDVDAGVKAVSKSDRHVKMRVGSDTPPALNRDRQQQVYT
ncbi:hypothetical protein ANO11243_017640 [Dothideomycetidae sp. 11243]|nr:hypothetical protein ANO11243_017640 [fungal sp. No.11243]